MKTELIHSYSSVSLSGLSRSTSSVSLSGFGSNEKKKVNGNFSSSETGLVPEADRLTCLDILKECTKHTFKKNILYKKVPCMGWIPSYNIKKGVSDVIAGLTVGLTILPQVLAYAGLAGLPPQYGLYSSFVGCFVYIFFGSTKAVNIGPTASVAIITLSYGSGKPVEYTVILTFLTGLVTLGMGIFQLGFIVNFISTPVMSGFTSAVAITIASTQIKSLLGLKFDSKGVVDVIDAITRVGNQIKFHDTLLSLVCILSLFFLQHLQHILRCAKRSEMLDKGLWLISTSRSAIVVIGCTLFYAFWGDPSPVDVVGEIVPGLPPFKVPSFEFTGNDTSGERITYTFSSMVSESTSALIVIPILALMEHITVAKAVSGSSRVDATQEMITIGLSNLVGSFFSSIPVAGSFSRTMVNHASGVASPMGGLVTGVLVLLALQFLIEYFFYLPKAALASVVVCAIISSIDFRIIMPMWQSKKMDIIPWGVTFFVSLLMGLEYGILSGFLISLLFLLYYAARPGVRVSRGETSTGIEFILIGLDRSLTFPSVEYINYVLLKSGTIWGNNRLPVVIDCQHIQFADYTAAQGMKDIFASFNAKKQELILWRVKPSVMRIMNGVMAYTGTQFKSCVNERQLENILEARRDELDKDMTGIKITFTLDGDENNDSVSRVSGGSEGEYQA